MDGLLRSVYLLSAFADGNLDYTRVHVLSLENPGQVFVLDFTFSARFNLIKEKKQLALPVGHSGVSVVLRL